MGFLNFLASIPTASNLMLKLKDAEARRAVLESEVSGLKSENLRLRSEVEQMNKQISVLNERVAGLEKDSNTNPAVHTGDLGPHSWMAR